MVLDKQLVTLLCKSTDKNKKTGTGITTTVILTTLLTPECILCSQNKSPYKRDNFHNSLEWWTEINSIGRGTWWQSEKLS